VAAAWPRLARASIAEGRAQAALAKLVEITGGPA